MKNLKFKLVIALMILGTGASAQEKETLTIPLSDFSKEARLQVSLVTGSINVQAYNGKEVIVEAKVDNNESKHKPAEKEGMKRINVNNNGFEITAKEVNNVIKLSIDKPNLDVTFNVKVPQKMSLKLSTVNNGDIFADGIEGDLEVSNVNGGIKLKNIRGSVSANTVNGDINVNFAEASSKSAMAFSNLNGNVDVAFPAAFKANFKVKTDRGDVFSDFEIDVDQTPGKVTQTMEKGIYKLNKDGWTYGKINGGGAEVMMKSMNGDIYIRKTK